MCYIAVLSVARVYVCVCVCTRHYQSSLCVSILLLIISNLLTCAVIEIQLSFFVIQYSTNVPYNPPLVSLHT